MATPTTKTNRTNATAKPPTESDLPLRVADESVGQMELFVQHVTPATVEQGEGIAKTSVAAYEVTFKAVLPEGMIPALLALAREHRLRVELLPPAADVSA